jgi:hypothetical protein
LAARGVVNFYNAGVVTHGHRIGSYKLEIFSNVVDIASFGNQVFDIVTLLRLDVAENGQDDQMTTSIL